MSMLVVVKYARREGLLLSIDWYSDEEGPAATSRMSDLEEVNTDDNIEIVMLCADSEQTMAMTHGKYFSDKAMRNIRAQQAPLNSQLN
jgi:hypothetical protein